MKGLRNFNIVSNGLVKQFNCSTEEVVTKEGYTDLVCKFNALSSMMINGTIETMGVAIEILDGVVVSYRVYKTNRHIAKGAIDLSFHSTDSSAINILLNSIREEADMYLGVKGFDFAYSLLNMVLGINSFDTDTYLYNNVTNNLLDIA